MIQTWERGKKMSGDHRIGPYELLAEEGHGAMGQVYRARDTRLDREVALKVLWPNLAREEVFVARFRREAKQTAAIDHPNVVRIYDVGEADAVVSRLLAREPMDRYPDCRAAIEDLTRWQRGEEVLPALPQLHERIDEGAA